MFAAYYAKNTPIQIVSNKPNPNLYIVDWLSHNNCIESKDQETARMIINLSTSSTSVNMPVYTSIENTDRAT